MAGGIAYTPKTWTAGQPLLASELNTEVRDFSTGVQDQWVAWTPTWGGMGIGNGTSVARYVRFGKTVTFRVMLTFGTMTTPTGPFTFSLPVAIRSADYTAGIDVIGSAMFVDNATSSSRTAGVAYVTSTGSSLVGLLVDRLGGTYATSAVVGQTVPWSWNSTDTFSVTGTYEAA